MTRYSEKIGAMKKAKKERLAENGLKKLSDFPRNRNYFGEDPKYYHGLGFAHLIYPSVTFSETRTYDLMILFYSYRTIVSKAYYNAKLGVMTNSIKGALDPNCSYCPFYVRFLRVRQGRIYFVDDSYMLALRKELSTRRRLTSHEKRAAWHQKYMSV